ncbi:tRNA pseudouridine synthase [Populus alba x Populus x berolinensis]|nr:tRNA pseudouridine synthase [Populus alba x Populus x berolinensis]
MAISSLRFPLSPWLLLKTPKLKPSFRFSFPILPSSRHTQLLLLSSYSQSPPSISPTLTDSNSNQSLHSKWESIRKKKVVLRVGYVGTDYRGLQKQHDQHSLLTIEGELERAIYEAGGIRESNYGNLNKISWARSSRTDKGVHSLATTITMKMEIPENAWKDDLYGMVLAKHVNSYLPDSIRVLSILPAQK